ERHPSRTVVLFPEPDEEDGLDGDVEVDVYPAGEGRQICTETIRVRLKGPRASAPASVIQPRLLPDRPAFLRWRGPPPFGAPAFGSTRKPCAAHWLGPEGHTRGVACRQA